MKIRIKNQLLGEIMVKAFRYPDGEIHITIAAQKTHPPVDSKPIRMGELEEIPVQKVGS